MSPPVLCAVILLACAVAFGAAQNSCKGRCGAEYYRGYMCQCDYNCLSYGECCKDFESQCTTKNSCKGRCGEAFKRGRLCSCDSDCMKYNQCCSDHRSHCDAEDMYSQILPSEFPNTGMEDPEVNPISESTSGYGLSTADLLDHISVEPTQYPDALEISTEAFTVVSQPEMTGSDNEPTQADDLSTDASDPTSLGTTAPQPTTAADHVSSQSPLTSEPQTAFSPTANSPEPEMGGQTEAQPEDEVFPEAQNTDPTVASSNEPDVTTTAGYPPVDSASTGPAQASQVTFIPDSSTLDPTAVPEATTSDPRADDTEVNVEDATAGPEDLSTSAGSDAQTTHIPTTSEAVQDDVTVATTADPLNVTPDLTKPTSEATSKPQDKPEPYKPPAAKPTVAKPAVAKPSSKPETKPLAPAQTLNIDNSRDYQADDSNDTNLCSGRPVSAVTALRNGTIVVFRGHYFWFLDRNRVPGPARGITQVWGIPSPIDTVFTRCNCQGKTYIFKGPQYWRFENDVLDPGYPKLIETGFDGLRGHITAALSVPRYQSRKESVYFFRRGGLVQKYSYQNSPSTTCGRNVQYAIYTVRNRVVRQAVSLLGPAVNIRTSWRGFPSTITAAVSVPAKTEPEGYRYHVFSRSKSYNVRIVGERPVIATPAANTSPQSNTVFKCPKTV
ncbi:proteoglycan 4b [Symphorus nematophorus]